MLNWLKLDKMNKVLILIAAIAIIGFSCKEDDSVTCTTCNAPQTSSFQVCKESDGNASVNGENTGTDYNVYITDLREAGANCG